MRRIGLAVVLAVSLILAPLAVEAQPTANLYRVGLIAAATQVSETAGPEPAHPLVRAFVQGLRTLGFINLKTAKALALTIPQTLLLRADEINQ